MKEAKGNLGVTEAQLEQERLQVRLDVEQARLAVRTYKVAITTADEVVTNARYQFRLAEKRYAAGVGSIIELGDAQVAVTSAATQRVQADYNLATARAQLLTALGQNDMHENQLARCTRRLRHGAKDPRRSGSSVRGPRGCPRASASGAASVRARRKGCRGGCRGRRPRPESCRSSSRRSQKKDFPIYLDGLGSAVPLHTVTVHTQVDGQARRGELQGGAVRPQGRLASRRSIHGLTVIQLHTAEAMLARDTAQAREGRVNLERYQTLRKENLIAQQQVDDQQALVDQYEATVRSDQAAIESARLNIDYAHITSPIDGVTGVRLIDPGNIVHAADTTGMVVLTQLDPMTVVFTLPEDDLPRISERFASGGATPDGGPPALTVEAYSRDGTQKLGAGKLTLIDNEINQTTATIRLRAVFDNPKNALWPNEFVKARLLLMMQKDAILVPAPAIQRGPQGTFVYVDG